jgi:hypothetical protein
VRASRATTAGGTKGASANQTARGCDGGPSHHVDNPSWRLVLQTAASATSTDTHASVTVTCHPGVSCHGRAPASAVRSCDGAVSLDAAAVASGPGDVTGSWYGSSCPIDLTG